MNESPLQTNESKTLFLMTSLPYYCIPGLAGTRWNKKVCAKDAGCAGNKITGNKDNHKSLNELNFCQIPSPTTELAALERLKNECIML